MSSATKSFFGLILLALILGYLGRPPTQQVQTVGPGQNQIAGEAGEFGAEEQVLSPEEAQAQAAASGGTAGTSGKKSTSKTTSAAGLACLPGKNGGRTDIGVSATKIKLATTAVLDGPAASLLRYSPTGMKAVIDQVNAGGGICGRRLSLQVVNDSFRADLGHQYIRNFLDAKSDIFALPVVPSAEGLSSAIQAEDISKAGMPVVGTDGMRIEQYQDPYVWPVASATVSTMRIIAKYAFEVKKARSFAIIWDGKYKFGVEGADAFKAQVAALGGKITADVKLDPDQPSYASEVAEFNSDRQCGNSACDAMVMLLLPDTAKNWLSRDPQMGRVYSAGAQTLFTEKFAQDCVAAIKYECNSFAIWTGYNPPIGSYATLPGVAKYVNDVKTINPGLDVKNQFLEGAYFGMSLFVEAIKKVGPNLRRDELKKVLDAMDLNTDISSNLSWRPGKHSANVRARSFSVVAGGGSFQGWADEGTGWRLDPAFGG